MVAIANLKLGKDLFLVRQNFNFEYIFGANRFPKEISLHDGAAEFAQDLDLPRRFNTFNYTGESQITAKVDNAFYDIPTN